MLVTIINLINILVFRIFFIFLLLGLNITLIHSPFTESLSSSQRPKWKLFEVQFLCGFKYRRKNIGSIFLMLPRATRFPYNSLNTVAFVFFLYKIFTFSECAFQGSKAQLDLTLAVILGLFCFPFTAQSLMRMGNYTILWLCGVITH